MGNAPLQTYPLEDWFPAEKTLEEFQDEAARVRKKYRINWQDSPNFRLPHHHANFLPPGTGEAILFAQIFVELSKERGGLVQHYVKYHPNVTAGLAGFFSGLVESNNIAMLEYDWTNNPDCRMQALKNYLNRACSKGVMAGLVRGTAWMCLDYCLEKLWDHSQDSVVSLLSREGSQELAKACGSFCVVPTVKLLIDVCLYLNGKALQNPCGMQNLTSTAVSIAVAAAMDNFVVGPATYVVAFIMGNFVNSYLFGVVRESYDRNESVWSTFQNRMLALRDWASKPSGVRWAVPDTVLKVIPSEMICCVSQSLFMEPVLLHDMVFEKQDLLRWVREHGNHPLNSNMVVSMSEIMPAPEMESLCNQFAYKYELAFE